ncbi:hypothetical protein GPX89_02270 [Nocardia sp. ET3-3]|uniref:ESX-1 secretion-associated protein n=1 Tax=Nocardia terrae TaxID=2675851 RepID=A0A7K1UP22_9NOCA|nr:hypothetical protein [Nocardia terrae]MVU76067.1 hypothetical protein [Nocardia terrae]
MDGKSERVVWDHPGAAAYVRAAGDAAALLDTARGHAEAVAGIDLAGLGTLGEDFAAAWGAAWTTHSGHLATASALTDAYGRAITGWGAVLDATDAESAARIAGIGSGSDDVQA